MELVSTTRGQGLGHVKHRPEYLGEYRLSMPATKPDVPPPAPTPSAAPSNPDELDDAALLNLLNDAGQPAGKRMEALEELVLRRPEGLDRAILLALQNAGADQAWMRALVFSAERVSSEDAEIRSKLADALFKAALSLRGAPDRDADPPLWSAVRGFGSVAPLEAIHCLSAFLTSGDPATTRQVALQAIWAMLEHEPPPGSGEVQALRDRVTELATKYIDNDQLVSPEIVSLATFAYCAAVLLKSPRSLELTRTLVTIGRSRMVRRSRKLLAEAHDARLRRRHDVEDLDAVLAELAKGER